MTKFQKKETSVRDLFIIQPSIIGDDRGFFMEAYNKRDFVNLGVDKEFVQDNHSKSKRGVLRGIHFQSNHPQGKLIRVIKGAVYDVGVDLRKGSPTYLKYFGLELSSENKLMLYLPEGFGHGFLTLVENTELLYKTTEYYCPDCDTGIIWNDPDISINWPFKNYNIDNPIISKKDANLQSYKEVLLPFKYR